MDLRIEIEPGSDPISGRVHVGGPGVSRSFTGWMGLVELIADAVGDLGESATDPGEPR